MAWLDNSSSTSGNYRLYFRASNDYGADFNPLYVVSCPASKQNCNTAVSKTGNIQIAASGNDIALVWKEKNSIFESASSDAGAIWTTPVNVTASLAGTASSPTDAMGGSYLYLTWVQTPPTGAQQIYFMNFSNYGQTMNRGAPLVISTGTGINHNTEDSVTASGNCVYVIWDVGYFSRSCTNGAKGTWSTPVHLNTSKTCCSTSAREPMIAANGSNVYVTWTSVQSGEYEAYVMVSNNSGTSFIQGTFKWFDLTSGNYAGHTVNFLSAREVQVSTWGNLVAVTYYGQNATGFSVNQWVSISTNAGKSFSAPQDILVQTKAQPGFGGVLVYNGNINVFWPHDSNGGIPQMFFEASADNGSTWAGSNPSPISNGSSVGMMSNCGDVCDNGPMLAASGPHVYLVWEQIVSANESQTMFSAS